MDFMTRYKCEKYSGCESCPIGDNIRHRMERLGENPIDYQPEYCYCDKIDVKHYMGVCSDAAEQIPVVHHKGKRKSGSAYRRKMARKAKKHREEICNYGCKPSLGIIKDEGYWVGSKNSNTQKKLKKVANKKIRQSRQTFQNSNYKKNYDYHWNWY